jgi:hypothetical protein
MKTKTAAEPAAIPAPPATDPYAGKGGSYTLDPATGARVPSQETQEFHKNEGKVSNEQENS